jgi:hypothetical protein
MARNLWRCVFVLQPCFSFPLACLQAPSNDPGPRQSAVAVIDSSDQIWWMSGRLALTPNPIPAGMNDLWKFDTKSLLWTWFVLAVPAWFLCPFSDHLRVIACQDFRNQHSQPAFKLWRVQCRGKPHPVIIARGFSQLRVSCLCQAPSNQPPGRYGASGVIDSAGVVWLFGGLAQYGTYLPVLRTVSLHLVPCTRRQSQRRVDIRHHVATLDVVRFG